MGVWQASDLWKGDDEQIVRAITRSHELGVNLVDTPRPTVMGIVNRSWDVRCEILAGTSLL